MTLTSRVQQLHQRITPNSYTHKYTFKVSHSEFNILTCE